jgi:hypothetical protein
VEAAAQSLERGRAKEVLESLRRAYAKPLRVTT